MIDRSLPSAFLIRVGNVASLDMADIIEALLDESRVTAIGLHMEGLNNVNSFAKAAMKALKKGVPIIAMKTCTSSIGVELAVGHTSSLAGTDELYDALFDRLGIIRVSGPVSFMETMKVATCGQLPKGSRVAALACSGGDAALIADYSEINNLQLPHLNQKQKEKTTEYKKAIKYGNNNEFGYHNIKYNIAEKSQQHVHDTTTSEQDGSSTDTLSLIHI